MINSPITYSKWTVLLLVGLVWAALFSCTKDKAVGPSDDTPAPPRTSPVIFDPALAPYDSLSNYNFFEEELKDQIPVYGVIPYEPITPLFTDYAHKYRFIWMPDSVSATYDGDANILDFPNGTVLIKTFYYDRVQPAEETRILETRLMFKINGSWQFANYVWNNDQTEALLDLNGSYVDLDWIDENDQARSAMYRIPSEAECFTCHKDNGSPFPIGPKPQNLNKDLFYPEGPKDQLEKWTEFGYLSGGYPNSIETVADWQNTSETPHDRVRAYLDINCTHCHADNKHCDYRAPRFAWSETGDTTKMGVCVEPDEFPLPQHTHIVAKGNVERSVLHYRLNETDETVRMPLLGRTIIHEEAVQLIEQWINTLDPPCN